MQRFLCSLRLYALLIFSALPIAVAAQTKGDTTHLEEVVVSENRLSVKLSDQSRPVSVITKEQAEALPARSTAEVLAFTPGLDIRQRGVNGGQADIGIRGGSFEQTLILLNGIKLTDPQTGHHLLNIPVPLNSVDRIEVMKGPVSHIFGQNGYAGAINIITIIPETKKMSLQLQGGDFRYRGGSIYASLPIKKYRQSVSVSHDASSGHQYNSDFSITNMLYESSFSLKKSHETRITGCFSQREMGANGFYTDRFPDQWEATKTGIAALQHTYSGERFYFQARTYCRNNHDDFRLVRQRTDALRNLHESQIAAGEINAALISSLGRTGLGVESRIESIRSTNLGNHSRQITGINLEHRLRLGNTNIRGGIYSTFYSDLGWRHFPGLEVTHKFTTKAKIFANAGTSFRIPSYTELYYQDPATGSNPQLKPEQARSYEAGFQFRDKKFQAELAVFRRGTTNMIDYFRRQTDSIPNLNRWLPANVLNVQFYGIETSMYYVFLENSGRVRFKRLGISYTYIKGDVRSDVNTESRYALTALKHQLIATAKVAIGKRFTFAVDYRYLQRPGAAGYQLIDAKFAGLIFKKASLFAEVNNVTGTRYVEAGFVRMPGRWFRAGLKYEIW